jgi:hypothetical protein
MSAMDSSQISTTPKNEEEDESDVDLTMFHSKDDELSEPDDCCHNIKKVSTTVQIFSIFITSL